MFGRNKSSQGASKTRDCSSKTNTNVEAGSDLYFAIAFSASSRL